MTLSLYFAFCVYAVVTSITPGPNNLMTLSSGLNFGVRKSVPLVAGICFGFSLMFLLVALGVQVIFERFPILMPILKVVGSVYILYLAYLIAFSGPLRTGSHQAAKAFGFWKGAIFQWVNPKSWIVLLGAVTAYTATSSTAEMFLVALTYGLIGFPCVLVWAVLGKQVSKLLTQPQRIVMFNRLMGILLAASLMPIWLL